MEATFIHSDLLLDPNSNTSWYRIHNPAAALISAGHTIHPIQGGTLHPRGPDREQADLIDYAAIEGETVLVERELSPDILTKLRYSGAKRIVLTFDDHYGQLPAGSLRASFWNRPGYYAQWLRCLRQVDLVIVPSLALLNAFKPYAAAIRLVPNYLDRTMWKVAPLEKSTFTPPVIGWGGSEEHHLSWERSPLLEALKGIQAQYQGGVQVATFGHAANRALHGAGVKFVPHDWAAFDLWPSELAMVDIGLAPLRGEYDRYRSSLKVQEYAALGIPWVASDSAVYAGAQGGMLVAEGRGEAARWTAAITSLVRDPLLRLAVGSQGQAWAEQYYAEHCVPLYEEILWPKK